MTIDERSFIFAVNANVCECKKSFVERDLYVDRRRDIMSNCSDSDRWIEARPIRFLVPGVDRNKLSIPSLRLARYAHFPENAAYKKIQGLAHWAVVYIAAGSGTYRHYDEDVQTVNAGSFFICCPYTRFAFGPGEGSRWDEYYMEFEGQRVHEWLATWLPEPFKVKHTNESVPYRMKQIASLMAGDDPVQVDLAALHFEAMLFDMVADSRRSPALADKADKIRRLLNDISDSIGEPFDACTLCERHRMSLPTLRRLVHQATGYPLHEYVHRLKMAEAKKMLAGTSYSIQDIASRLGYGDAFYFSRLFKKFESASPQAFRNSVTAPDQKRD